MYDWILNAIKSAARFITNLITKIIHGVLDFFKDILNWFKNIRGLNKNKDIPFVGDGEKFKEMLKKAPTKDVGVFKGVCDESTKKAGIFEGVYDESTDEITHHLFIEADSCDEKTKELLRNEPLVVLS